MTAKGSMSLAILLLGLVFLPSMVPRADAHNWVPTPGRNWGGASTTKPCKGRKSTDTHQQIGPGQTFTLGFQTGHGSRHYLVVVHGDDEHWLAHPKLVTYVEQYIAEAPAGSNLAFDPQWQRRHATRGTSADALKSYTDDVAGKSSDISNPARFVTADNPKGSIYSRQVPKEDTHFTTHSRKGDRIRSLFEYRLETLKISGDKRFSYKSDKFPWLESVHRFQNLANHGGDTEVVRIGIDDVHKRGSGHFVAHWRWQGYRECVDVDYFADRQITHVDGKKGAGVIWNKVEHCQFEDPSRILTPVRTVGNTAEQCVKDLGPAGLNLAKDSTRVGIQIAPLKKPAAVKLWDQDGKNAPLPAPFDTPAGVNENPLTTLTGADSVAPPGDKGGWTGWFASSRVKETKGKKCKSIIWSRTKPNQKKNLEGEWTMTLRDAVLSCTESPCKGFAWKLRDPADKWAEKPATTYDFMFCATSELLDSTEWDGVVMKQGTALVKPPTVTTMLTSLPFQAPTDTKAADAIYKDAVMVSFQPKSTTEEDTTASIPKGFKMGKNFFLDNGEEFGARGDGQEYGWSCSMTDNMKNGFQNPKPITISTTNAQMKLCSGGPTLGKDYRRKVRWSFKVANGVYAVYAHLGAGSATRNIETGNRGCSINNVRLGWAPSKDKDAIAISLAPTGTVGNVFGPQAVVVRNGRIDFTGPPGSSAGNVPCNSVSWIRFKRIGAAGPGTDKAMPAVPTAWFTGTTKSWWHRELNEANPPVGLVIITPPSGASARSPNNRWSTIMRRMNGVRGSTYSYRGAAPFAAMWSCRSRWLWAGDDCAEGGLEMAQFDPDEPGGDNVGYTVTVSDQPCSGTAGCPSTAKTTVCKPTQNQPFEPNYCLSGGDRNRLCPITHDCKGATGHYIRIELRGERRIFDARVDVNRATVDPSSIDDADNKMLCWAVTPRTEMTLPVPKTEFYTTTDPEDPVFYSTCYLKEIEWIWEDTGKAQKPTPSPWKVNGECIDCDVWKAETSSSKYQFPLWRLDPRCPDCEAGAMPLSEWKEHDATIPGTSNAGGSGAGTGITFPGGKNGIDGSDKQAVDQANAAVGNPVRSGFAGIVSIAGSSNVAVIGGSVGGAVGALVVLAGLGMLARKVRRKHQKHRYEGKQFAKGGSDRGKKPAQQSVGCKDCGVQMQDTKTSPVAYDSNSPWQQHYDESSGEYYYHNTETDETSWDAPAGFARATGTFEGTVDRGMRLKTMDRGVRLKTNPILSSTAKA